ncbi:MAG: CopG family transcriptional regulator [Thermoprotei archaeon]|nr:MAG: CopG family transcriptional regulator [Thermoprotei archaeon]
MKFGVYIPEDLALELEKCMKVLGIKRKSRLIQEALKLFINEHKWRLGGEALGVIGVIYDHTVSNIDSKLTDIQHDFLDIILGTLHIHLDKRRCMLAIVVRGNTDRLKELLGNLINLRGVIFTRQLLLSVE